MNIASYIALTFSWPSAGQIWDSEVLVGTVPSVFLCITHVENVLARAGIGATADGSLAYGIFVNPKHKERALQLLKRDLEERPWHYEIHPKTEKHKQWQANPAVLQFDADMASFRQVEAFRKDAVLRGIAREGFEAALEMFPKRRCERPFIKAIKLWPMPYLGEDFKMHSGYKAEVEIRFRANKNHWVEYEIYGWAEGRETQRNSGSGR